jgi:hypothetical protein
MRALTLIRPVNSIVFVSDRAGGITPLWEKGQQILWNDSCISIACYPEQDGPTEISIGTRGEVDPGTPSAFEGELKTPDRAITVSTVDQKTVLEIGVASERTHICVWLSDPRWPAKVTIGLG